MNKKSEDSFVIHNIIPVFSEYGYPGPGDEDNFKIKGDIRIPMGSTTKEPDLVFYANGVPVLVVENKGKNKSKEKAKKQLKSYIRNFPIKDHSVDGRPPEFGAVTIGKKIFFYKYKRDINKHGGIEDKLVSLEEIFSYEKLCSLYGIEAYEKTTLTASLFKDLFYELLSALDKDEINKVNPDLILKTSKLIFEFLKDKTAFVGKRPYSNLDGSLDRQKWIRNKLKQYSWDDLDKEISYQFRKEIMRSFQGAGLNKYITPDSIVNFMVELSDVGVNDKVLDFECGSGSFIASAVEKGVDWENICGVDIAKDLQYITKTYLALRFNLREEDLDNLNIYEENGLYFEQNTEDWDVIISNPAGGSKYDKEGELNDLDQVYKNLANGISKGELGDPPKEYTLSILQSIKSCKDGGRICLILPEGFFANSSDGYLREYVSNNCKVKSVISLPRKVFRKGTTTKSVKSGGSQQSLQKMSIIYLEKEEVENNDYPVFLASIKKPNSGSGDVNEWLPPLLKEVYNAWLEWKSNKNNSEDSKNYKEKDNVKISSSPSNTIPDELEDIF